jgi:glycosyltransferase involved in cell wall biosynthesis
VYKNKRVAVVIPALNEAASIGLVLRDLPRWIDWVVVVDNGSTDGTAEAAARHRAEVVREDRRGYGSACQAGVEAIGECDIVIFLDGDYSDHPEEAALLVDPIAEGTADLVIGSRAAGNSEPGSLTPQQRIGNALACFLMRLLWRAPYTDLGPFRAIRRTRLQELDMRDRSYGWTIEMQIKAVRRGLRVTEVPVSYRRRIGSSKVSGTVRGTVGASYKILGMIARHAISPARSSPPRNPR